MSAKEVSNKLGDSEELVASRLENSEALTYQTIFEILEAADADIADYFKEVTRTKENDEPT